MNNWKNTWIQRRKRMATIVEMGSAGDWVSRGYDILSCLILLINLTVTFLHTFSSIAQRYGSALAVIEAITVAFFAIDYVLRVWTAPAIFPDRTELRAVCKYVFSLTGILPAWEYMHCYRNGISWHSQFITGSEVTE